LEKGAPPIHTGVRQRIGMADLSATPRTSQAWKLIHWSAEKKSIRRKQQHKVKEKGEI